jgi:hypothetical protein
MSRQPLFQIDAAPRKRSTARNAAEDLALVFIGSELGYQLWYHVKFERFTPASATKGHEDAGGSPSDVLGI